ncbi:MAG: UDP-glucose/GDP-mannose dehydrogenase family protein [Trueperaceae bacterium]|nr:UDP-glucose/GDP-mannose dehydrogenase family protein [Trueperaceae bacterium]
MRVTIVGTGYVGLVTGACLADIGHIVTCVDIDPAKAEAIERGEAFLYEPGLQAILDRHAGATLRGTTDLAAAVCASDLTMIAVGTPSAGGRIDLSYIETAARQIGEALRDGGAPHVVVVKSTVVPGTTEDVVAPILLECSGRSLGDGLGVAMNPEFLAEGNAVADFATPDRIVLGVADSLSERALRELYAPFEGVDLLVTTPRTAEAIKYASNAALATLISFSNEIGNLVATLPGVDVRTVMEGLQLDRRWSPILEDGSRVRPGVLSYLAAGCGFGGSCFPKDVEALAGFARAQGVGSTMLDGVLAVNALQPTQVVDMLERGLGRLTGKRIAVLGVAFKPNTDDVRASATLSVVRSLLDAGAIVGAFDPIATITARAVLDRACTLHDSLAEAVAGVDAVAVMTAWPEFHELPSLIAGRAPPPLVVDGRRMLDPASVERYVGIGLGPKREEAPTRP